MLDDALARFALIAFIITIAMLLIIAIMGVFIYYFFINLAKEESFNNFIKNFFGEAVARKVEIIKLRLHAKHVNEKYLINQSIKYTEAVAENVIYDNVYGTEKKREEIKKMAAETRVIMASAGIAEKQISLLDKIISDFDMKKITPEQCFVLVKSLSPSASAEVNISPIQFVEQMYDKMKAENRKSVAEANIIESQSDVARATAEKTKRDLKDVESNRDSLKRK